MLTKQELDLIRVRMEEEHTKDMEALERIMRFLPVSDSVINQPLKPSLVPELTVNTDPNVNALASGSHSVLGGIEKILSDHYNRTWTSQQIKTELETRGVDLLAKNPMATVSVTLKKLLDRQKIKVVRLGAGREPHIYQWRNTSIDDCVASDGEKLAS